MPVAEATKLPTYLTGDEPILYAVLVVALIALVSHVA